MNRGYIKFWRKAQDSLSWNRGLMYQGLIINILTRAAWKKGSYQGRDTLPGQFGVVMSHFAESLQVPRSTLQRMVAHLEADDFLKVENVGNRFVIITIVNWHSYQETEKDAWATGGQPVVNQRAADGQPSYKEEEVKKEEEKNINTPPLPPASGGGECVCLQPDNPAPRSQEGGTIPRAQGSAPRSRRQPTAYSADFESFWVHYPRKIGKDAAWRAYKRRSGEIPKGEDIAAILARHNQTEQWQRDGGQYIPHPATWRNQGRWKDDVRTGGQAIPEDPPGW